MVSFSPSNYFRSQGKRFNSVRAHVVLVFSTEKTLPPRLWTPILTLTLRHLWRQRQRNVRPHQHVGALVLAAQVLVAMVLLQSVVIEATEALTGEGPPLLLDVRPMPQLCVVYHQILLLVWLTATSRRPIRLTYLGSSD